MHLVFFKSGYPTLPFAEIQTYLETSAKISVQKIITNSIMIRDRYLVSLPVSFSQNS